MKPSGPGLWNIQGYERAWKEHPEIMDFLKPSAPNHREKMFQRDVYMELLGPFLEGMKGKKVLDAAGGIGRFAVPVARMGNRVVIVDACRENLEAAGRHGKGLPIECMLADIEDMGKLEDGSFDAALAIEAVCYCSRPERALSELKRLVRPGGKAIISVENRARGAGETVSRKGDVHVRLYTEGEFRKLLESSGMRVLLLEGCHYISDGPFDGKLPMTLGMERKMRKERRDTARAWLAVCEVEK